MLLEALALVGLAVLNYKLSDSDSVSDYIRSEEKKAKRTMEDIAYDESRNYAHSSEERARYREKYEDLRDERRETERAEREAAWEAKIAEYEAERLEEE